MVESKIQTSFAAGEVSKNLYARVDIDKFSVGAALLRNFFVDWRGGVSNRAGTKYVNMCKTAGARLIRFEFSVNITYVMEFGQEYIRFYTSGDPVTEPNLAILSMTNANPGQITIFQHGYSVGDELVLSMPGMPNLDTRQVLVNTVIDTNNFTISDLFGNPINTTTFGTYQGGGSAGRVYTLASPYQIVDVFALNFIQSADVVTIVHPNYVPQNLSRVAASQFTLTDDIPGPVIQPPTGVTATANNVGNKHVYGYVVTSIDQNGSEESIMSVPAVVKSGLLDQTASPQIAINIAWTAPANQVVSGYKIYKWGPIDAASGVPPTIFGYIGQTQATSFQDNNIAADFSTVPEEFTDPFSPGQITNIATTAPGGYTTGGAVAYVPLTITGDGTGAAGYAVIEFDNGHCVGAFITQPGKGYTTATITAGAGGAAFTASFSPSSGTYPSVVSFVQQRRSFAAPIGDPQAITMSQTGNFENFDTSPVVLDSDAITLRLASGQVDYIKSMVPMSTGLVLLSSGGAWLLSGGTPGAPITPSQTTATRQASHGANQLPAFAWNYDVLYMQQKGNTVRDLAFNFYLQSYVGNDRSYLSQHLFTNFTFTQWCAAEEPLKLVWVVRGDGTLLTMTYVPEQEVYGWAHHDTQGLFRSVETVSEGTVDAVYVIVSRYVQPGAACGSGWYDFIERFDDRQFDCSEDVWFLDCAVSRAKQFPNFTVYDSGSIAEIGGNIEVCAAPTTQLPRNLGTYTAVTAEEQYQQTTPSGVHGFAAFITDWDNQVFYYMANGGLGLHQFGMTQFVGEINNWNPGDLQFCTAPGGTDLGYDFNIYGVSGEAGAGAVRFNTSLGAVDATWNDTTDVFAPSFCQALQVNGHNIVWFYVGDATNAAGVSWKVIDMDAVGGPTLINVGATAVNYTSLGPSFICQTRSLYTNVAFALVNSQDNSETAFAMCYAASPTSIGVSTVKMLVPTDIHAAATTLIANSACLDETDGNIVAQFGINGGAIYMVKINSLTGAVMWSTQVTTNVNFRHSRIRFGKFAYVGTNQLYLFNTLNGTFTTEAETQANGTAWQSTDAKYGQIIWNINDIGAELWATFGQAEAPPWAGPGETVQIGCGKMTVVSNPDPFHAVGTVLTPITNFIPNDPSGNALPVPPGNFSVALPTQTISTLWHLEGKQVMAVADGNVVGPFTVVNGEITLPHPATNVIVGLWYNAQLQTLYLDAPGPNMQGKRKTVPAATLRLADSRGPKVGRTFDDLVELDDLMVIPGQTPMPLMSGDFRVNLFSDWETTGQLCVQQDYPLPLTVLGIIPEFVRGDTAN